MSQITTHILDTSRGEPARGVRIVLSEQRDGDWHEIASGITNDDGRVTDLLADNTKLAAGTYQLRFATVAYYKNQGLPEESAFYPVVEVAFRIAGDGQHYHVPLLLNPFGYSTYRGS